jgi:hypothetical protein
MRMKIYEGTPAQSGESLCQTCRHSTITRGRRFNEEIVRHARRRRVTRHSLYRAPLVLPPSRNVRISGSLAAASASPISIKRFT